jgi:hypothetical protein
MRHLNLHFQARLTRFPCHLEPSLSSACAVAPLLLQTYPGRVNRTYKLMQGSGKKSSRPFSGISRTWLSLIHSPLGHGNHLYQHSKTPFYSSLYCGTITVVLRSWTLNSRLVFVLLSSITGSMVETQLAGRHPVAVLGIPGSSRSCDNVQPSL